MVSKSALMWVVMTSTRGLPPRVMLPVDLLEPLGRHVRVDLGGGDVGVPEHRLDRPQVRPAREQVAGKGVAQAVRGDPPPDAGLPRPPPDPVPEGLAGDRAPPSAQEEGVRRPPSLQEGRPAPLEIDLKGFQGREGDRAMLELMYASGLRG